MYWLFNRNLTNWLYQFGILNLLFFFAVVSLCMAMPQLKLKCAGIENVMEGITGIEIL